MVAGGDLGFESVHYIGLNSGRLFHTLRLQLFEYNPRIMVNLILIWAFLCFGQPGQADAAIGTASPNKLVSIALKKAAIVVWNSFQ